jgi:hypothetical protein
LLHIRPIFFDTLKRLGESRFWGNYRTLQCSASNLRREQNGHFSTCRTALGTHPLRILQFCLDMLCMLVPAWKLYGQGMAGRTSSTLEIVREGQVVQPHQNANVPLALSTNTSLFHFSLVLLSCFIQYSGIPHLEYL